MATNPKDEIERLNQQPGALVAGNAMVSTPPKGAAVSSDPNNAAKFAKVPDGIGGNPAAAPKPVTPAASTPPAAAPVAAPGATDQQRTSSLTAPAAPLATAAANGQAPSAPAMAQPQKAAASGGDGFMQGVRDVYTQSGNEIANLASQGRYGAALGETVRAATAYVPAVLDDVVGGAVRAVGPGVLDAGRQALGLNSANAQPALAGAATQGQKPQSATAPWDHNKLAGALGGLDKEMAAQSRVDSVLNKPSSASASAAGQNPMVSFDRTGMTNAQVADANPAGKVTAQRQANGTLGSQQAGRCAGRLGQGDGRSISRGLGSE